MATKIQIRRDTAANWQSANPVLMEGEMGLVLDNPNQYKVGDGVKAWNDLPLRGYNGTIVQTSGDSEDTVMSQKAVTDLVNRGYQFMGVATPDTNPGTPDGNVFYIASESGTYTYFNNITLANGQVAILKFNTNWDKELIRTSFINKFIPFAANEAVNAISELYLTGLNSNETYKISNLTQQSNGYRLYIRNSSDVLVALVNDDGVYNKIQKIYPNQSSGISGYCIINTFHSTSNIGKDTIINNSVVSELDESPSIRMFLGFNPNIEAGELLGTFDKVNIYSPNINFIISSNGQETGNQNSILKCVKYLGIYGNKVSEKRYAVRVLQRNTERTIRLALTEFGSSPFVFDKTYTIPEEESIPQYLTIDFGEQQGSFGVILTVDTSILVTNAQFNVITGECHYYINPGNHINTIGLSLDEQINGFWKIKEPLGSKVNYAISFAGQWMKGDDYLSIIIPVIKGDKIFCIGNSAISTNFRLLADITSIPNNYQPVSETGEIVLLQIISPNQEFNMVIPSGVKYVIFSLQYTTSIRPFQKIKINDLIIPLEGDIKNSVVLESGDSEEESIFDIASGSKNETCITDDSDNYNISYESVKGNQPISLCENENFVIVGHDDLSKEDYLVTRKIYNKYGFNGTFNYILSPFSSISSKNSFITNVRRLVKDGNHIGFHAIFSHSYFWRNPLYDIKPDGTFTFAPILSELQGSNDDHTGLNVFGRNITLDTVFSDIGFISVPNILSTLKVINATSLDIFNLISAYSLFGATQNIRSVTGLDLEDQIVTKGELEWLEYWLNSLIDPSFGYSTISSDISARYAADYSIPSGAVAEDYYPDANHLKNGKIVFYDEVNDEHYEEALIKTDPNFTESSYQLVGKFNKGLFKGCASCCNFEVIDRVIDIATAFVRKYIGVAQFDNMAYHGAAYVNCFWYNEDGTPFGDRETTIYATGFTPLYVSHLRNFYNLFSLVKEKNIRTIKKLYPNDPSRVEGQIGFYQGQREFRGSDFNDVGPYDIGNYLALFGKTESGQETMSYDTFIQYASQHKDWLIWACENANEYIPGTSETYKVYSFVLDCIDAIRDSLGTGKLPFLGIDTIGNSPSVTAAIECVCRYCYENNIHIINMNDARVICNNKRNVSGNMFPNPSFNQSLYRMMNYTTLNEDIKRPDGWRKISGTPSFNVYSEGGNRVLSLSGVSAGISTRIYGLPAGTYKFSAYIKCSPETSGPVLKLYKKYNKELVNSNPSLVLKEQVAVTSDTLIEQEFSIEEPFVNPIQNNKISMFCGGYENNVAYIRVDLMTNGITYLHSPSIVKIG